MNLSQFQNLKFVLFFILFATNLISSDEVLLTPKEKAWIEKNKIVKVGGGPDWAPFDFVDLNGKYGGIGKDYLNLISAATGLEFDVKVDKWKNNLQKIKNSEIDILHAVYYTQNRTKIMDYTQAYFEMLDYFFVRNDMNVKTVEDLNGMRVAIPKGYAHGEIILKEFPQIKLVYVDTFSQAIDAVIEKKADILFDTLASIEYALKKENITSIVPFHSYRGHNSIKMHMSTAKNKPELLSIMNKALDAITNEEKEEIHQRWFSIVENTNNKKISFTKVESEWMKNNPVITYSEINWEPMSIIKNGTMVGIMNEYLKVIQKETGLLFQYKKASSWTEVIDMFKNKEVDIIPGIGASDYESKLGLTSDIYADFPFVLVTKTSESFINDISELHDKTIAVPKYWTSYNYLNEKHPNIKVLETQNLFEALDAVKDSKADAFLGHMAIGMHYVGTYYPKTLHIAGKVEYNFNHKILIQKDNKILLSIINKVFNSISESQKLKIKNKWLHVKVHEAKDYTLFYQIGGLLFLIVMGTVYWNRKLSHEIFMRKKIEDDLKVEKDNFKILFEKVSDGNLIIQNGKFVTCNDAAINMLGLDESSEVLESSPSRWSPSLQPDGMSSIEKESKMIELCLEKGSHRFDWMHKDIEDKEFWVDVGLTKISYEGKEGVYVVWRDISEQKTLEESLKERELQMRTLIDNIPVHVIVSSYEGKVYLANKQTLIDYEAQKIPLNMLNVTEYYANSEEREEILHELKTKGFVDKKIVKFKRPSGIYSMMFSLLPIRYENQDMLLSIGVDLTERLKLESLQLEAKNIAEQANRSKSEFLANMSHEIRTPMNAIIGFTELLNEQVSEPRLKSYVKTIQTASTTLLTLINDILDLSKIEAGKLTIDKTPTDLANLCNEVSSIFMMSIKNKGLDLFLELDETIPQSLLIDEVRLRQILLNLIGNSVKFTQNGYIKLSVKAMNIDEHLSKVDIEIRVEDSGVGIAASQLEKIFQEFEQSEGQDNRKFGGTGLGLSISQRLSVMMGGEVTVSSEENKGTVFTINLPHIDISSIKHENRIDEELSENMKTLVFKEAKVLVVDDIEDNRELVMKNFENTKIEILTANNGLEAIDIFKKESPNLILMDIRMPVMDGYEAAMEIKKLSNIPIVALTASVMSDEYEKSKRMNFDGFLRKPVLRYELYTELSKFLEFDELKAVREEEESFIISEKAKLNIATILKTLSVDIKQLQVKAQNSNNISDIRALASQISALALEFDIEELDKYASKLYEAVDTFDIMLIEELLNKYDEIPQYLSDT